jgi:hypothetical protein
VCYRGEKKPLTPVALHVQLRDDAGALQAAEKVPACMEEGKW